MRILIVLAVVAVGLVALFVLLNPKRPDADVERVADPSTPPVPALALSESTGERALAEGAGNPAEIRADATSTGPCRIEIVLVAAGDDPPQIHEVTCFDEAGNAVPLDSTGALSWVAAAVKSRLVHVEVRPLGGWMPVGRRVSIPPGATTHRVEIQLQREPTLRVRWQTTDGRPFVAALERPGTLRFPITLRVSATADRLRTGDPTPVSVRSLTTLVAVDSEPKPRRPFWTDAPPDAFGVLTIPTDSACAVHASIGGIVVESVDVPPGTAEVVFHTDLEVALRAFSLVRFCVVTSESGEPLSNVSCRITSGWGSQEERSLVDGCLEELRLSPGAWRLSFRCAGRAPLSREITLAPGDQLDLGRITLAQECPLTVQLLAPDGLLVSGVQVSLQPRDGPRAFQEWIGAVARDGVCEFASVPDESLLLAVFDPRWVAASVPVEPCARSGTRPRLTVQLQEGVPVALDFGPTSPLAAPILLTDARGFWVTRRVIGLTGLVALRLAPGEYRVTRIGWPEPRTFRVGRESAVIEMR